MKHLKNKIIRIFLIFALVISLANNSYALPVELSYFTASVMQDDVTLTWGTLVEINNEYFYLERKIVGSADWIQIDSVQGQGTTSIPHDYEIIDPDLSDGDYNYRLKQVDFNGDFNYHDLSGTVVINNVSITNLNSGVPDKFRLHQNYPNPFNPSTKINFDLPFNAKVNLKVFDMTGREVMILVNEFKTAGFYTVDFNASNLSTGVYLYRISADANRQNFASEKRMMLVK